MLTRATVSAGIFSKALMAVILVPGAISGIGGFYHGGTPESRPTGIQDSKPGSASKARPGVSGEVRGRIRQAIASVGLVLVRNSRDPDPGPRRRGSGVIVQPAGVIATNLHVITERPGGRTYDEIYFRLNPPDSEAATESNTYRLRPLSVNRTYDLALLAIEINSTAGAAETAPVFPSVEIGDSKTVQLLDDLFIIGYPEKGGATITVNPGLVEGKDMLSHWIKTDARVIHGNSGGAAVDTGGKLIGIPTKVVADTQEIDKDGDGFPDETRVFGAVGFLRPSHLVAAMLEQMPGLEAVKKGNAPALQSSAVVDHMTVRGVAVSSRDKRPVAGALVGLLPPGTRTVSEDTLLTWGRSNSDGHFVLNRPVPPGKYTVRVKALGFHAFTIDIEIRKGSSRLAIELNPLK